MTSERNEGSGEEAFVAMLGRRRQFRIKNFHTRNINNRPELDEMPTVVVLDLNVQCPMRIQCAYL